MKKYIILSITLMLIIVNSVCSFAETVKVGGYTFPPFVEQEGQDTAQDADIKSEINLQRVTGLEADQKEFKILIVDDRQTNRKLMLNLLEPIGFNVKQAENGKQAVEIWKTWEPHLIWMDMRTGNL